MDSANRNRAALAFVSLLAAAALGYGYIIRSGGDPGHLVGGYYATPDAAPTLCRFNTVRGPSEVWTALGLVEPDGGSGLAAAKTCFHVPPGCEQDDASVWELADSGVNPAPCEVVAVDGGVLADCPDATVPWASYRDLCATEVVALPTGIEYLSTDEWERPYIPGEPVFEVWTAEHKDAPWRCACGAAGFVPDAGPCERFVDIFGAEVTYPGPITPGGVQMMMTGRPQLDGGVWEPISAIEEARGIKADRWRGNCRRMPCGTWSGMNPIPAECRAHACDGLECGMGRAGELCGPVKGYRKLDEAGNDLTCAGNRWERECPVCPKPRGRAEAAVKPGSPRSKGPKGKWYVAECPPCPE